VANFPHFVLCMVEPLSTRIERGYQFVDKNASFEEAMLADVLDEEKRLTQKIVRFYDSSSFFRHASWFVDKLTVTTSVYPQTKLSLDSFVPFVVDFDQMGLCFLLRNFTKTLLAALRKELESGKVKETFTKRKDAIHMLFYMKPPKGYQGVFYLHKYVLL